MIAVEWEIWSEQSCSRSASQVLVDDVGVVECPFNGCFMKQAVFGSFAVPSSDRCDRQPSNGLSSHVQRVPEDPPPVHPPCVFATPQLFAAPGGDKLGCCVSGWTPDSRLTTAGQTVHSSVCRNRQRIIVDDQKLSSPGLMSQSLYNSLGLAEAISAMASNGKGSKSMEKWPCQSSRRVECQFSARELSGSCYRPYPCDTCRMMPRSRNLMLVNFGWFSGYHVS